MFSMKKIEAGTCARSQCSNSAQCGSHCGCLPRPPIPYPFPIDTGLCIGEPAFVAMIKEHPKLCQSHDECMKKGSGKFCARYPNNYIDYGWCFDSDSEALKGFLAMPRAITK